MNPFEWSRIIEVVTEGMRSHTRPFASPISTSNEQTVRHRGSGTFVTVKGQRILLSCEHVMRIKPVEYRMFGSDTVYWLATVIEETAPGDLAFGPVPDEVWRSNSHAEAVALERFAERHAPADKAELMFLRGYAGENSGYGFGVLETNGTGYCTQVNAIDSADNRRFDILWDADKVQYTSETTLNERMAVKALDPHGLSGSLLWNTRYIETTSKGGQWLPEASGVTGLVDRWDPDAKTLLVHRVEFVRQWLDAAI